MLKFTKILLLSILLVLLFTTISLGTFTADDVKPSSSSDEFQPISIVDSILNEYENNSDSEYDEEYDQEYDEEYENATDEKSSGAYNPDSFKPNNKTTSGLTHASLKPDEDSSLPEITSVSSRITSLIRTIGIVVSIFVLLPICLICGILYMVKSKTNNPKKTIIGIIIISIPIIIFAICAMLPLFSNFANM